MPGNLDEAGNNSFFTGYREAPLLPVTNFRSISTKNPMDSIKYIVLKKYPTISAHEMDGVWTKAREPGADGTTAIDLYRDEAAFKLAIECIADRVYSTTRVVRAYITHKDRG